MSIYGDNFLNSDAVREVTERQKNEALSKNKDESGYEILFDDIGATFDASKHLVDSALNATSSFSQREFEDIPEMMNPGAGPDGILPKLAITASQFVGMSQPQMLDVIREQDPNAVFSKDKYKNIIVTFGNGTQGYVNKPGLSAADVHSFLGLSKVYGMLPFETVRKFVAPLGGSPIAGAIKDMGAKGLMFGGVSVGQDIVATPLGSKQGIDNNKLVWNVIGGTVGAPIISWGVAKLRGLAGWTVDKGVNPILNKVTKSTPNATSAWTAASIKKLQTYTDENGFISRKGIEQLEANDPELIELFTKDELNIFGQSLEQSGGDYEMSKLFTLATKHGIDLNAAQITGDPEELAKLEEAKKGSYGENLQKEILKYTNNQDKQLVQAAQSLFSDKNITIDSLRTDQNVLNKVGITIQAIMDDAKTAADNIVTEKYEAISGNVTTNRRQTDLLKLNIKNILKSEIIDVEIGADDFPKTRAMINTVNGFTNKITGGTKLSNTPSYLGLKELESYRKYLATDAFKATGNDHRGATLILTEFDKYYSDVLDASVREAHLLTPEQVNSVNAAREAFVQRDNVFGLTKTSDNQGITDKSGKWVNDVLYNQNLTGFETMQDIMGYNYLGKPKVAISRIDKIYDAIQYLPNSKEVLSSVQTDFKDAFLSNLMKNSLVEENGEIGLNLPRYINNINKFTDNDLGMELTNKILSPREITELKSFAAILQKTAPGKKFINYSNTASSIARVFESHPWLSTIAKTGAYDAYGLKGLFTFRAFSSLKTAPTADKAKMLGNILNPAFEFTEAEEQAINRGIYGTLVNSSTPTLSGVEEAFGERIPFVRSRNELEAISIKANPNQDRRTKEMLRLLNY